jgi:hypothetical protein
MITWTPIAPGGANLPEGNPRILVPVNGEVYIGERTSEEQITLQVFGTLDVIDATHFSLINTPE